MKKVAVIGSNGYVGRAMSNFFNDTFSVIGYDRAIEPELSIETLEKINSCDLAVICVPTPMSDDGVCDTSIVEDVLSWLDTPLILIKSTIPPGTADRLGKQFNKELCFSPEYIGEGKYFIPFWKYPHPTDMKYHDFVIIGGEKETASAILEFFKEVGGPDKHYYLTDAKTAELCKYMENAWGATKVTFVNEFYEIAKTFGINFDELRELWLADKRVERMHTMVLKDKRGFGGKCFPKDVNAIVKAAEARGYLPKLLRQVLETNKEIRGEK